MSVLDYTTDLFRDPERLREFVEDPQQALSDAGLPDATPEQVYDLMSLVAESMPPDHPLQDAVHADDLIAALRAIDIDELIADSHDHHREVEQIEKAIGTPETLGSVARTVVCGPDEGSQPSVKAISTAERDTDGPGEKALGEPLADDPLTPQIEGPYEDYPEPPFADELSAKALDEPLDGSFDGPDVSPADWGKALE